MTGIAAATVIDVHAHVRLNSTTGAAGRHGPEFGEDADGTPWYRVGNYKLVGVRHTASPFTDPELRIERMDRDGIDFQVLSPSPLTYFHHIDAAEAIPFCQRHNDACAELVKNYPHRLGGLAALPMQSPAAACEELERAVTDLGLWGAATGTEFGEPLHSEKMDPLYQKFVDLDVPLFLHPAPSGIDGPPGDPNLKRFDLDVVIGFAAQESIAVATLIFGGVLERHPALDIWISHGGGGIPMLAARLAQAARRRPWATDEIKKDGAFEQALTRLWYDAHVTDPAALSLLRNWVGNDRIVYGTNFAGWDQPESGHHGDIDTAWAENARRLLRQPR
ncbi:MAG: aminocarboxymuconate-semialdehyde decarboxylase [Gammaproteobacteria bacterium]|jgi:aminocarboxymuconate-semialdehyde decarboxylase